MADSTDSGLRVPCPLYCPRRAHLPSGAPSETREVNSWRFEVKLRQKIVIFFLSGAPHPPGV